MKKNAELVIISRGDTLCVICGKGIARNAESMRMYPPTQKGGVNSHRHCYETAFTPSGWAERGRCSFAKTQNGVNVDDSENTVLGQWYSLRFDTDDRLTADYLGNNGFTVWATAFNEKGEDIEWAGQLRRNNAQQLTRLAKVVFKNYSFKECTVDNIECKCTDDIHNAINQSVQNQEENIIK